MGEMQPELLKVSGVVEAVAQHDERRYSIKVGGDWYGGFGTCPAAKGDVYVIEYTLNGRFRNIKTVREVGEAVAASLGQKLEQPKEEPECLPFVPVAVRNYVTPSGWHQSKITPEEEKAIQSAVRQRNCQIASESLEDARRLLGQSATGKAVTPRNVLELALHLSERRTVHISKVYDEFIKAKIAAERRGIAPDQKELVSDEEAGAQASAL